MNKETKDAKSPILGSVFRIFFIVILSAGVLFLCIKLNEHSNWGPKEMTPVLTDSGIKPSEEIELLTADEEDLLTVGEKELLTVGSLKFTAAGDQQKTAGGEQQKAKEKTEGQVEKPNSAASEKPSVVTRPPKQDEPKPPNQDEPKQPKQEPKEIVVVSDDPPGPPQKEDGEQTGSAAPSDEIRQAQEFARKIADTVKIDSANGNVSYKQDDIPNYLHLTFKAEAFNLSGACVGRFVSDAGWMVHPENYDSAAKELTKNLGVSDFTDKMVIVNISMRQIENNEPTGEHVALQIIYDYDGSVSERMVTK